MSFDVSSSTIFCVFFVFCRGSPKCAPLAVSRKGLEVVLNGYLTSKKVSCIYTEQALLVFSRFISALHHVTAFLSQSYSSKLSKTSIEVLF